MFSRAGATAARLRAEQLDSFFVEESRERPHRVAPNLLLYGQQRNRPDNRGGDALLPRAGLCDQALLTQPTGEEGLTHYFVELGGPAMAEVFPLQIELRSADVVRKPSGEVEWRR